MVVVVCNGLGRWCLVGMMKGAAGRLKKEMEDRDRERYCKADMCLGRSCLWFRKDVATGGELLTVHVHTLHSTPSVVAPRR